MNISALGNATAPKPWAPKPKAVNTPVQPPPPPPERTPPPPERIPPPPEHIPPQAVTMEVIPPSYSSSWEFPPKQGAALFHNNRRPPKDTTRRPPKDTTKKPPDKQEMPPVIHVMPSDTQKMPSDTQKMPPVIQVMPSDTQKMPRSNKSGMLPDKQRKGDRNHRGGGGTTNYRDRQAGDNQEYCPFRIFKPDAATCSCGKVHPDNSQQTLRHSQGLKESYERARQAYHEYDQQLMASRPDADRAVLIEALSASHMLFVVERLKLVDFNELWNIAYRL